MVADQRIDFRAYLESLYKDKTYSEWQYLYTPLDAFDRQQTEPKTSHRRLDLGLVNGADDSALNSTQIVFRLKTVQQGLWIKTNVRSSTDLKNPASIPLPLQGYGVHTNLINWPQRFDPP
ncbi:MULTISPECIES: hypothetical protein [unclassified Anabaena]|uniref:hypothetical protein n=1 Tax=unclassified Anabaena TaxID=2619674 RepID=UPI0039C6B4B7